MPKLAPKPGFMLPDRMLVVKALDIALGIVYYARAELINGGRHHVAATPRVPWLVAEFANAWRKSRHSMTLEEGRHKDENRRVAAGPQRVASLAEAGMSTASTSSPFAYATDARGLCPRVQALGTCPGPGGRAGAGERTGG